MRDENARVRFDAVHALGFIAEAPLAAGSVAGAGRRAGSLRSGDTCRDGARARPAAASAKRAIGCSAPVDDSSQTVRQFAVESLGFVREDRALPRMRDLIARAGDRNVDGLALALARIGAPDDLALLQGAPDRPERRRPARRGGRRSDGSATGRRSGDRTGRNDHDRTPAVRLAAAFALHRLGRGQSQEIAAMLADESGPRRRASICSSWAGTRCPASTTRSRSPSCRVIEPIWSRPSDISEAPTDLRWCSRCSPTPTSASSGPRMRR